MIEYHIQNFRVAGKIRVGQETGNTHIFILGLRVFCQKDANGIANSEDPDQTAAVCPDLSVRKLWIITVFLAQHLRMSYLSSTINKQTENLMTTYSFVYILQNEPGLLENLSDQERASNRIFWI